MRNTNRTLTATLALSLSMTLSACGADDGDGPGAPSTGTTDATVQETDGTATPDDDDADDTSDDADATSADATGRQDVTASALAAIARAEAEVDGTAYEVDDQDDDGTWEVDVRVGDRSLEVSVSADGTTVVETGQDDDLDDEDRAALDAATLTLAEAVNAAVGEVDGVLDGAELEEEDGAFFWEVGVDQTDAGDDDVDVRVDVTTGDVTVD